jgi:hypothetical protein
MTHTKAKTMSDDEVSEDDCVLCGHWPPADRWALREMIESLPLKEATCAECEMAFWRKIAPDFFKVPTKH